ncbi:MAG: GPW/gp25 family protein [Chitinophagaceae bacterium]|nr:GPW/gp25 family protein [Chitinophagaceae bacterium]
MELINNDKSNYSFLGRGWSFPPQFEKSAKTVVMLEDEQDIRSSLEILLSTAVGERVMDVNYGCNMDELIFESLSTSAITIIKDKIEKAILFFEPRIEVTKLDLNTDSINILEGRVLIEIEYIISATNSRYNFVYPFYVNEGTEIQTIIRNNPV